MDVHRVLSMGSVRRSTYRRQVTPSGLEKIEKGTLGWLEPEVFANFNTEVLEEYLNEKARNEGFERNHFYWRRILLGVGIGTIFALINQYVGLKVGLIVGGSWYIVYLIGLLLRWTAADVNVTAGSATGADRTNTGFVFTYPAIYLLAFHPSYALLTGRLITPDLLATSPHIFIALVSSILGAMLGINYFVFFRRIWLIEDPIPYPGFEASAKLAEIAENLSKGDEEGLSQAKASIKAVGIWGLGSSIFTFLRDAPVSDGHSMLDAAFGSDVYAHGHLHVPFAAETYTHFGFEFTPIQFAIGWFQKFRIALMVSLGTIFSWYFIVPLAVSMDVPVFIASWGINVYLSDPTLYVARGAVAAQYAAPPFAAFALVARIIAIGALLGGGLTALFKMAPVFKTVFEDMFTVGGDDAGGSSGMVEGKGWFEWPVNMVKGMIVVAFFGVSTMFMLGGFPALQSLVFAVLLCAVTFLLGAIACKIAGETGTTPVSGTSFIILILLIGTFKLLGTNTETTIFMALIGTTVFGTAVSLSSDIMYDFKIGVYAGSRPYYLMKGELTGVVPGAIVSAFGAFAFSYLLATQKLQLAAPQAHAFATFANVIMGGNVRMEFFMLGIFIGVFVELLTGLGTAFGLGMYLPIQIQLPALAGGALRDTWEAKWLKPRAQAEGWDERTTTFTLVKTFMAGTGLIIGEALVGTSLAIYLISSVMF